MRFAGSPATIRGVGRSSSARAGGHPLDDQRQRQHPGRDELGVDGRERGLQPGRAHRRLLERDLLLVTRVRGVIGRDAVDHAASQPLDQRLAVALGAQRRVHLHARVEAADVALGQAEVVRRGLAGHLEAALLRRRDGLDGLDAAQVLHVDAAALVAGQRGVARDHRGLRHARDARDAEQRADLALVHRAVARERRILLVQGQHAAAQALVLQREAQHPGARDRLAVVGEAQRALVAQLGHLGQLGPVQPARDRRHEADGDAGVAQRACRAAIAGAARCRSPGRCSASRRPGRNRRPPRRACRSRDPPCAPGRACAGARAGPRTRGTGGGRRLRRPPRPPGASSEPGAPISAIVPPRTRTSAGPSSAVRGSSTWASRISRSAGLALGVTMCSLMPATAPVRAPRRGRRPTPRRGRPCAPRRRPRPG